MLHIFFCINMENLPLIRNADMSEQDNVIDFKEASEENKQKRVALEEKDVKTLVDREAKLNARTLDHGTRALYGMNAMWRTMLTQLLQRFGNDDETVKFLTQVTDVPRYITSNLAYNAVQLADLHNYFLGGRQPLDEGSLFVMDDYARGVMTSGTGMLPAQLNIFDSTAPGAEDPRWSYDDVPTSRVVSDPTNGSVPVKVETFTDIFYGYLECYKYNIPGDGTNYEVQTTHPGIRTKNGWITINSIYRWFETDAATVKNAWNTGTHHVKKVIPSDNQPDGDSEQNDATESND